MALQALYQWSYTGDSAKDLIQQFQQDDYWGKSDTKYFSLLVRGSTSETSQIDEFISAASDYDVEQIDPIELAALRLATYELLHIQEIPPKVIIAEAIRLCKKFGSDEGFKLVNVVLDNLVDRFDRSK